MENQVLEIDYKSLYLKYKRKYTQLRKQIGGITKEINELVNLKKDNVYKFNDYNIKITIFKIYIITDDKQSYFKSDKINYIIFFIIDEDKNDKSLIDINNILNPHMNKTLSQKEINKNKVFRKITIKYFESEKEIQDMIIKYKLNDTVFKIPKLACIYIPEKHLKLFTDKLSKE